MPARACGRRLALADRPHTFKGYASYRFNYWNMSTDVGATQLAYSGTPVTTRVLVLFAEHIAFGREDLGPTDAFTQTNVLITHRWNITERVAAKFTINMLDLWDERNEVSRYEAPRSARFGFGIEF